MVVSKRIGGQRIFRFNAGRALGLFWPWNSLRRIAIVINCSLYFELFLVAVIIASAVVLAINSNAEWTYIFEYVSLKNPQAFNFCNVHQTNIDRTLYHVHCFQLCGFWHLPVRNARAARSARLRLWEVHVHSRLVEHPRRGCIPAQVRELTFLRALQLRSYLQSISVLTSSRAVRTVFSLLGNVALIFNTSNNEYAVYNMLETFRVVRVLRIIRTFSIVPGMVF